MTIWYCFIIIFSSALRALLSAPGGKWMCNVHSTKLSVIKKRCLQIWPASSPLSSLSIILSKVSSTLCHSKSLLKFTCIYYAVFTSCLFTCAAFKNWCIVSFRQFEVIKLLNRVYLLLVHPSMITVFLDGIFSVSVCAYMYMLVCVCVRARVCVCMCTRVCVQYVCACVCICVHSVYVNCLLKYYSLLFMF